MKTRHQHSCLRRYQIALSVLTINFLIPISQVKAQNFTSGTNTFNISPTPTPPATTMNSPTSTDAISMPTTTTLFATPIPTTTTTKITLFPPTWTPPPSLWCKPYQIYTNNCHHAANCGLASGCTGIFACTGRSTGVEGHTINYSYKECSEAEIAADPNCVSVCLSEPQSGADSNGDGIIDGPPRTCCWSQSGSTPNVDTNDESKSCYKSMCDDQPGPPTALPPGVPYTGNEAFSPSDCKFQHPSNQSSCESCCVTNADFWRHIDDGKYKDDADEYLRKCKAHCRSTSITPTFSPLPEAP